MAAYSRSKIIRTVAICRDEQESKNERGSAFEELSTYLLSKIPGVQTVGNIYNVFHSEEIDIAVANGRRTNGLEHYPPHFLVECKNWSKKVGAPHIDTLTAKMSERGVDLGVLITALGIAGKPNPPSSAHHKVSLSLAKGLRIVVVNLSDLEVLKSTEELNALLHRRLLGLIAAGTTVSN